MNQFVSLFIEHFRVREIPSEPKIPLLQTVKETTPKQTTPRNVKRNFVVGGGADKQKMGELQDNLELFMDKVDQITE